MEKHPFAVDIPRFLMVVIIWHRERKQVLFLSFRHKRVCVFLYPCCVCIREASADRRALGDYRTGQGTITHQADQLATDRQAGLNGDCSLIGICNQQATKSIYPWGKPCPILTFKQKHSIHTQTFSSSLKYSNSAYSQRIIPLHISQMSLTAYKEKLENNWLSVQFTLQLCFRKLTIMARIYDPAYKSTQHVTPMSSWKMV